MNIPAFLRTALLVTCTLPSLTTGADSTPEERVTTRGCAS